MKTEKEIQISVEDEKEILELSLEPAIFEKISKSIAPAIFGYPEIKQAIALQLFKNKEDNFNLLLVGDPGTAKTEILKSVSEIFPEGLFFSNFYSVYSPFYSSYFQSEDTKLQEILINKSKRLFCIEDLQDSKEIRQIISDSSFSLLASSNPSFGRFDPMESISNQINILPQLLNRFDVIFILRDLPDKERDKLIAESILYKKNKIIGPISKELLQKYIVYANNKIKAELSEEAIQELKQFYIELRNYKNQDKSNIKPIPISVRQLKTLVKMSKAFAKIRLSNQVSKEDAVNAINIMKYFLMCVGYDYKNKEFDISRIEGDSKIKLSEENKFFLKSLKKFENRMGKLLPIDYIEEELKDKLSKEQIQENITKLTKCGEIFRPRKDFIQRM